MKNPHDLTRTPLGSSGGSGISVAAAYAVIGIGTDTGGSIRNPSAATGIVGLKPTHGLISRDGIVPLALTFDTAGPLARMYTTWRLPLPSWLAWTMQTSRQSRVRGTSKPITPGI